MKTSEAENVELILKLVINLLDTVAVQVIMRNSSEGVLYERPSTLRCRRGVRTS
jgi:hypothetical protein